ncbi:hypothetical protein D3C85_1179870 [compost metagenome]
MESPPALRKALMPSTPWAWAVTWRPMRWAEATIAASSSSLNCWARPAAVLDRTPPVAVILMISAPLRTWRRTARMQSSTPEQTLSGDIRCRMSSR